MASRCLSTFFPSIDSTVFIEVGDEEDTLQYCDVGSCFPVSTTTCTHFTALPEYSGNRIEGNPK